MTIDRKTLIEPESDIFSIAKQCELLGVNRSSYYYKPKPIDPDTLALMRRIDEIHTEFPYYGEPRITATLKREGIIVNHKRIARLMKLMGIEGIMPRRNTSKSNKNHPTYPYLLKNLKIDRPNYVWGTDITYIPLAHGFVYLVALLDWFSRYVVSWKLAPTMTVDFCVDAINQAIQNATALPDIHNSDQGSQFTSYEYTDILKQNNIQISMDGRGRCFDNIFTERLWRSVKYEEVYLKEYKSIQDAHENLSDYFTTYNTKRLHQSLNYQTPAEIYFAQ